MNELAWFRRRAESGLGVVLNLLGFGVLLNSAMFWRRPLFGVGVVVLGRRPECTQRPPVLGVLLNLECTRRPPVFGVGLLGVLLNLASASCCLGVVLNVLGVLLNLASVYSASS